MKKAIIAIALAAFASTASAAVTSSAHDLTSQTGPNAAKYGTTVAGTTPCQFCHTPHKANPDATLAVAPLWNRNALSVASWTMYAQAKVTGTVDAAPNANSLTCLACHEGSAALGSVYSTATNLLTGGTRTNMDTAGMLAVGTNLNDDHPVAIAYAGGGATEFPAVSPYPLYNTKVECATCHDPHDTTNGNFLRDAAGTLCGACHTAK